MEVEGLGLRERVECSVFSVQCSGCRVQGSGFRVQGSGFRVQGSGFRVTSTVHSGRAPFLNAPPPAFPPEAGCEPQTQVVNPKRGSTPKKVQGFRVRVNGSTPRRDPSLWVVGVGGDDGELRPWHYIYEGRMGRWETPTMALNI